MYLPRHPLSKMSTFLDVLLRLIRGKLSNNVLAIRKEGSCQTHGQ